MGNKCVRVCVLAEHRPFFKLQKTRKLARFQKNPEPGAHQLVFTQLWLKDGAVGISELDGRLHQCLSGQLRCVSRPSVFNLSQTTPAVLHFSAGEPHLYLAKQTICVKN